MRFGDHGALYHITNAIIPTLHYRFFFGPSHLPNWVMMLGTPSTIWITSPVGGRPMPSILYDEDLENNDNV